MQPTPNTLTPPPELVDIQNWLSKAVTSGKFVKKEANLRLTHAKNRSSSDRLMTYIDDYWPRCLESLTDDFPRTARTLDDEWETVCEAYLAAYPSTQFTLYYLGKQFPQFIVEQQLSPWLRDLAQLEWALLHSEISAVLPTLAIDEHTILKLQPHCSLLQLQFQANDLVNETPSPEAPQAVMVYQWDGDGTFEPLDPLATRVFKLFEAGTSLSEAFDSLSEQELTDDELTTISTKIQSWMSMATQWSWLTHYPPKENLQ